MRRKLLIASLAALILLVGGGLAYWHHVARQLETGLAAWIAERKARGWIVRVGAVTRGDWGLSARLTAHDVEMTGGDPPVAGGVAWHASSVVLKVDLFDPWRLFILPRGVQGLRLPDGSSVTVVAEDLVIGLARSGDGTTTIDIDVAGLNATARETGADLVSIGLIDARLTLAEGGDQTAGFAAMVRDIRLAGGVRWPLGQAVETVALEGALTGVIPDAASPKAAATAWRDNGGSIALSVQSLVWGPLTASGSATLALDDELQPMGAGTAHVTGFVGTLDALGGNGVLTPSAVKAAKAVLTLMAGAPSGREPPTVDVPLTLQLRTLSMRQIPLALLPELDWAER